MAKIDEIDLSLGKFEHWLNTTVEAPDAETREAMRDVLRYAKRDRPSKYGGKVHP